MRKQPQNFGRLTPRNISYEKVHAAKKYKAESLQNRRVIPTGEKVAVWSAYFTMVYATIVIFQPEAAIAAVQSAKALIG